MEIDTKKLLKEYCDIVFNPNRFYEEKSPKRKTPFDYTHYICPTCEKMEFLFGLHQHCHYCQECGQKLDWTKIENEQYTIWEER